MSPRYTEFDKSYKPSCDLDCHHCGIQKPDECEIQPDPDLLKGWPLSFASISVFILPIMFAIIGALLLPQSPESKFLGTLVGFGSGGYLAMKLSHHFTKPQKETT